MESRYTEHSTTPRAAASIAVLLLVLGGLAILTIQPATTLEPGNGMGNYKMPPSSSSGQGVTPPSTTSSPNPNTTPSAGNTATPATLVDFLTPTNETATNP